MCTPIQLLDEGVLDDGDAASDAWPACRSDAAHGPGHSPVLDDPADRAEAGAPRRFLTRHVRASGGDLAALGSALATLIGDHDLDTADDRPARGAAQGSVHGVDLAGVCVAWVRYDTALKITARPLGDIVIALPAAAVTVSATVMLPDSVVARRRFHADPGPGVLIVAVPAGAVRNRWRQLAGTPIDPLRLLRSRLPDRLAVPRLARAAAYVCSEADHLAPVPPRDAASLADRVTDALLFDLHDAVGLPASGAPPARGMSAFAERAVCWLYENRRRSITVTDLADVMGVTEHCIQDVFAAEIGPSPAVTLRGFRLDDVHERLLSGQYTTIPELARSARLHPGRLATYYSARFGETPSETAHNHAEQAGGAVG